MKYAEDFLKFINSSPTPYHAVANVVKTLTAAGFTEISEKATWTVTAGGKYFVQRNNSSIIAFSVGSKWQPGNGIAIIGAHTDSPCLRVKPVSAKTAQGYLQVGVETYGGGLWPTWFDRDLSVAGRVYVSEEGKHVSKLVKINKPLLRIPTLAIHLHREQSSKLEFNKEDQLEPILGLVNAQLNGEPAGSNPTGAHPAAGTVSMASRHAAPLLELVAKEIGVKVADIEDFELLLYDTQDAVVGGLHDEFVFSPRLDNLCSSYCATQGLLRAQESAKQDESIHAIALFDHEEVGSQSAQGAGSTFLTSTVTRLATSASGSLFHETIAKSFLLSADMAHAVHPNYVNKHEKDHQPKINGGPVIKVNANQRYATNSVGIVLLQEAAKKVGVPLQLFVVRNDMPCGSTIGPIIAANTGLRTLDLGNPQLSMHSIREMAGTKDLDYSVDLFESFFSNYTAIDKALL